MRVVAVAFLAALMAIPASAQILTDPTGDVKVDAGGQGAPVSQATAVDLTALSLNETPDAFRFTVKVADLGGDQPRPDAGQLSVLFTFDGMTFMADFYRSPDNAAYFGSLYSSKDGTSFHYLHDNHVARDLASSTVWQDILRADLVGASGKTPGRGDSLENIHAQSRSGNIFIGLSAPAQPDLVDFMPDAGGASATWAVQYQGHQGVGASLDSPQPFRSSNGEATTYTYQVTARQSGTAAARFTLTATRVPEGWNVTLPGGLLELAPEAPVTFPVRIAVPFNHVHGAAQSVTLRLEAGNGTWATLDLGIHYTTIPQPAGHHPSLYLHSQDWSQLAYYVNPPLGGSTGAMVMNTLDADPADTGKPVEGYSNFVSDTSTWTWNVCLSPELAIGIDMDLKATGTFTIPVTTTRPLTGAVITGDLILLSPGDGTGNWCFNWGSRDQTPLAHLTSDPKDLAANTPMALTGTITADPQGDYIPYADGAQIVLQLVMSSPTPAIGGEGGPFIQPGAVLTLPISEYHEVGTSAFVKEDGAAQAPGFVAPEAPKSSPAAGPLVALGLAALAVVARRRK